MHIPRDKSDYSALQRGYPLTEEFLDHLAEEDIDLLAIDDGEQIYVFELSQYRRGSRVGHAPYPMKRVAPLDDAAVGLQKAGDDAMQATEWLTEREPETDQAESIESDP